MKLLSTTIDGLTSIRVLNGAYIYTYKGKAYTQRVDVNKQTKGVFIDGKTTMTIQLSVDGQTGEVVVEINAGAFAALRGAIKQFSTKAVTIMGCTGCGK